MRVERVSELQEQVLAYLAEFQYLTNPQLVRLTGKSKSRVSQVVTDLQKRYKPLVQGNNYTLSSKVGKQYSIYYLTPRGKMILEVAGFDSDKIKLPRRSVVDFTSDYHHRVKTIDAAVAAKDWAQAQGYQLDFLQFYFQTKNGSNRDNKGGKSLSANRIDVDERGIGYIIPDTVFLIDRNEQKPIFGLFEQHNGKETKRALEQIHAHCVAGVKGAPSIALEVTHQGSYIGNRVFYAFELESCMLAVMRRLIDSPDFQNFKNIFHFALSDDLKNGDFSSVWYYVDGSRVKLE